MPTIKTNKELERWVIRYCMRNIAFAPLSVITKWELSEEIPTACTDGFVVKINPQFTENLNKDELTFLIHHELQHINLLHFKRLGQRNMTLWNIATDHEINLMENKAGRYVAHWSLCDSRFEGMTAERIYEILQKENPDNDPLEHSQDQVLPAPQGKSKQHIEKRVKEITQAKAAGERSAKKTKKGGAKMGSACEEYTANKDDHDWRADLQHFLTEIVERDISWRKPNRRYMPDFYLPSQDDTIEYECNPVFAVDTSGSTYQSEVDLFFDGINSIMDQFSRINAVIFQCDTRVRDIRRVTKDDFPLKIKKQGGGGTDFTPVFSDVENMMKAGDIESPSVLVYFTDLCGTFPNEAPDYPVVWVTQDRHIKVPFGEVIYI